MRLAPNNSIDNQMINATYNFRVSLKTMEGENTATRFEMKLGKSLYGPGKLGKEKNTPQSARLESLQIRLVYGVGLYLRLAISPQNLFNYMELLIYIAHYTMKNFLGKLLKATPGTEPYFSAEWRISVKDSCGI